MKISGIYKIESKIKPERIYIGSAVNIDKRWKDHLSGLKNNRHDNSRLQNHFNKYGEIDLQFSILLGCEKEYLIINEQFFLDSYKPFFNILKMAGSTFGSHWKLSEEAKRNIGNGGRGRFVSEETRKKISDKQIGISKPYSDETRKKTHERMLGNKQGVGYKHTKEAKNKMSVANRKRKGEKRKPYRKLKKIA